jgi:hypothetical protein
MDGNLLNICGIGTGINIEGKNGSVEGFTFIIVVNLSTVLG